MGWMLNLSNPRELSLPDAVNTKGGVTYVDCHLPCKRAGMYIYNVFPSGYSSSETPPSASFVSSQSLPRGLHSGLALCPM